MTPKSKVDQRLVSGGNRCTPVEQVVHANFHHLDIAIVGGERVASKRVGRRERNDESPVAKAEIVVFELHCPRERIFEARAYQPAPGVVAAVREVGEGTARERHARGDVGNGQVVVADPAAASLAVQPPVGRIEE